MAKEVVGVHPVTGLPLVRAKHKFVKPKSVNSKEEDKLPLNPFFCPVKDPETKEQCGKLMGPWDTYCYNIYGMCEDCFRKYNKHVELKKPEV